MIHKKEQLVCRAFAKVNLSLHVGRLDSSLDPSFEHSGLHPICSWMHSIELCDRIEIVKLGKNEQSRYAIGWAVQDAPDAPVEWDTSSDLCVKAHLALESHVGKRLAASIQVSKSIPAGGGLGGGSSDAASVLMGLNVLFGLDLVEQELVKIAMGLGSDVPFFVDVERFGDGKAGRSAIVEGLGDLVTRAESAHIGTRIVLIVPAYGCHTGQVYRAFDEQLGADPILMDDQQGRSGLREMLIEAATTQSLNQSAFVNDLTTPAVRVAPQLGELIDAAGNALQTRVHVSGSGSTLFVIGETDVEKIRQVCPDCQIIETRLC